MQPWACLPPAGWSCAAPQRGTTGRGVGQSLQSLQARATEQRHRSGADGRCCFPTWPLLLLAALTTGAAVDGHLVGVGVAVLWGREAEGWVAVGGSSARRCCQQQAATDLRASEEAGCALAPLAQGHPLDAFGDQDGCQEQQRTHAPVHDGLICCWAG
jgi:hypothetical protein